MKRRTDHMRNPDEGTLRFVLSVATKKVWECRKKCVHSWKIGEIGQVMWHCSALSCGETERVEIPRNSAKIRWKSAARKNRAGKWHAVFGRGKKRAEKVLNLFFHGCGKFVVWTTPPKSISCTKFPLEKCEKNVQFRFLHRLRVYSTYVRKRCRVGIAANRLFEVGFSARISADLQICKSDFRISRSFKLTSEFYGGRGSHFYFVHWLG